MFALLPAVGLSNAAATLVGQNLGAGKPERAESSVWKAAFVNAAVLGAVSLIFLLFSNAIVGIFTDEPQVLAYGTDCLHIVAYGFVFYAFGMVLESSFNGAGDTWTPTFLNLFIFWLFEIPLAFVLSYGFHWVGMLNDYLPFEISFLYEIAKFEFKLGPNGVFWAITIAFSLLAIVSALLFRRGKWKTKTV
jgi:Na+-driven multidrug efflux pump